MVLEYDFDIVTIEAGETDPKSATSGDRTVRALFRDDRAVEALRQTSPKIRWIFEDAGFGLEPIDSNVAHGYYRPRDAADRERILRALFANIRDMGVRGEIPGEFDLWQFLDDVKTARPIAEEAREVSPSTQMPQYSAASKPKRRSIQGRIGLALGLAVIVIAILRYLAAAGSTP
ncbi:hypothetical protein [Ruegeria lacuscaerulensis]|uniref:hypothetical protein n=1 Tax=Ruegeria lacuscaerulensis TaxID=55218 RepID=UPI00147CD20B|nr:hypothetical protein [Ruegeria lacuscaerulensis]